MSRSALDQGTKLLRGVIFRFLEALTCCGGGELCCLMCPHSREVGGCNWGPGGPPFPGGHLHTQREERAGWSKMAGASSRHGFKNPSFPSDPNALAGDLVMANPAAHDKALVTRRRRPGATEAHVHGHPHTQLLTAPPLLSLLMPAGVCGAVGSRSGKEKDSGREDVGGRGDKPCRPSARGSWSIPRLLHVFEYMYTRQFVNMQVASSGYTVSMAATRGS